ncbi:MAG TPA: cyclic nucleotide-binding domain-containing protein [Candidatus Nitrosotalea sp.]|nr:cyclic nucleotide-binding domain-containing protein [Candidatus Nitrosotalea sp.]
MNLTTDARRPQSVADRLNQRLRQVTERDPKLSLLRGIPMFAELSRADLARVAGLVDHVTMPEPGETLIREGAPNRTLVILTEGEAEVSLRGKVLRRHGPGDLLGLPSLLDGREAGVTVRTVTPARALVASVSQFESLRAVADLDLRMRSSLTERLRQDYLTVARPGAKHPASALPTA